MLGVAVVVVATTTPYEQLNEYTFDSSNGNVEGLFSGSMVSSISQTSS